MSSTEEIQVEIRQADRNDIKDLIRLAEAEDWDYSYLDINASIIADPNFLYVAICSSGETIGFGGISHVAPGIMYLGPFVVSKIFRRKGIGRKIWNTMLQRAGQINICLDAISEMIDWYAKQGFIYNRFKRYFCETSVTSNLKNNLSPASCNVKPFTKCMMPRLIKYEKTIYPTIDREKFLSAFFQECTVLVAFSNENVVGFGCFEQTKEIYGIRYLYGENGVVFESLLGSIISTLPDDCHLKFTLLADKALPEVLEKHTKITGSSIRMLKNDDIIFNTKDMWIHAASI